MSDNPFSEPDDGDRTVVHGLAPKPAAPAAPPRQPERAPQVATAAMAPMQAPLANEADEVPKVGLSPIAAAAAPLLDLLSRIGSEPLAAAAGDADELRQRAMRAMQVFEAECRGLGVAEDQARASHYALCVALDDVALATPWGQASSWPSHSLASTFHQDVKGGERIFLMLANMQKEPGRYKDALEVCYLCLSLGLQGRYRLERNGHAELDRIREGLYQLLVQLRGGWERELSPRWRGVDAPHRRLGRSVPLWVAAAVVAVLLGFGYVALSQSVNAQGDGLQLAIAQLPPPAQPGITRPKAEPPPAPRPPPQTPSLDHLRRFLDPEIRAGLVTVEGDGQRVLVRITGRGMFGSGSADVEPRLVDLMNRIGEALREEPGRVTVLGHTDDKPIRTVRYPSNFHLSSARAKAAADILVTATGTPARFTSEGRADNDPIASNGTPEGREQNRRIEIILYPGKDR